MDFTDSTTDDNLLMRLQEIATDSILSNEQSLKIIKMDSPYPFQDVKRLIKEKFRKTNEIFFIITSGTEIKGKVTNKINEFKNKISLVKMVEISGKDDESEYILKFFDEKIDKKSKVVESFEENFFIYKMVSNEKEYLLLSFNSLELQEYTIKGMEVEVGDMADIGNYTKLNLKIPLIFVCSAQSRIIKYNGHAQLFKNIPQFDENQLMRYIFSSEDGIYFKHPRYFERLIASFLFSTKYDSSPYPLHLLIIGEQGSGKSKVIENLHWKFGENTPITDGSCSTIKSLIPSFKSTITIQTGDLIKSNRICCVDEFLRILVRIPSEEREPQLAALNPLLEHKERNFGSGNYSFKGKMTSKMICASNPVYGTSDIVRLANKIDKSFLSRLLIFYQNKSHFKMVADADEKDLEKSELLFDNDCFISFYDYLCSFKSKFDYDEVRKIYLQGLGFFGEEKEENEYNDSRNIYLARYKHHIQCLIDGLVKLRSVCERDMTFEAKQEDYDSLKEIWFKIIKNMGIKPEKGFLDI